MINVWLFTFPHVMQPTLKRAIEATGSVEATRQLRAMAVEDKGFHTQNQTGKAWYSHHEHQPELQQQGNSDGEDDEAVDTVQSSDWDSSRHMLHRASHIQHTLDMRTNRMHQGHQGGNTVRNIRKRKFGAG